MISLIVAMDKNGLIGRDNQLPWNLPSDLKYFKEVTSGGIVVMGRKTYESIGRPLPNRDNIILTRDRDYKADGCIVVHGVEEINHQDKEVFVIGGNEIFKLFLDQASKLYITHIEHEFEGDTYFPPVDFSEWVQTTRKQGTLDDKNKYLHFFSIYEKNIVIKNKYKCIVWADEL